MADDFVIMRHPDTGGLSGRTPRKAFEDTYRDKGWQLADPADAVAADVLDGPAVPVADRKRDDLFEMAVALGLDPAKGATKADLLQMIEASPAVAAVTQEG